MKKILVFAGSARKKSLNIMLARNMAEIAKQLGADVTFIDLAEYPMPIYEGDLEGASGLPENAKKLKKLFHETDGFIISSPEYNGFFPPLLKNVIDWISRPSEGDFKPFLGKKALILAASPGGLGGVRVLPYLRILLSNLMVNVIPQQIGVPFADKVFDENGNISDESLKNRLKSACSELLSQ